MDALMQAVVQDSQRKWLSAPPETLSGRKTMNEFWKFLVEITTLRKETLAKTTVSHESEPDYCSSSLFVKEIGLGPKNTISQKAWWVKVYSVLRE